MGNYEIPANVPISATWQDHRNRNPPSNEPGTDYACAYGTDLAIADNGVVSVIDTGNGGGEGRRCSIDLDDGRRVSYIHLSRINAWIGQRVGRGQTGLIISGASGNGDDWYYGPHVHVSLWERPGMSYSQTIDFQNYVGEDNDMGTIDNTPENKQIIKDSIYEFMIQTDKPPAGYDRWPFMAASVWNAPVQVQDANGWGVVNPDGTPKTFPAQGFIASSNALANDMHSAPAPEPPATLARLLIVIAVLLVVLVALVAGAVGIEIGDQLDPASVEPVAALAFGP